MNDVGAIQFFSVRSYSALLNKVVVAASLVALKVPDKWIRSSEVA
jgi:hypothetical protein